MEGTLKTISIFAVFVAIVAVAVTPALAVGPPTNTPPDNQGTEHKPATPGPHAGLPAKAKAYGRFCSEESKKHADAAEGTKGTPFSQCVSGGAKLLREQRAQNDE